MNRLSMNASQRFAHDPAPETGVPGAGAAGVQRSNVLQCCPATAMPLAREARA